ncbi:MAG: Ribosomal RNA large subunit methyltransferase H [Chlamydiae bacterium]|nr:Ribosomal RNA large subunit methyltransferase H [Chlamydiota bacterium]
MYSVGKNKEKWLQDALELYQGRLSSQIKLKFIWSKNSNQLLKFLENEKKIICFDPVGFSFTSEKFSSYLFKALEEGGTQLALVIGEAQGLPEALKKHPAISLSKMVFTHQMARLIVAEQIYRALAIKEGLPYHLS